MGPPTQRGEVRLSDPELSDLEPQRGSETNKCRAAIIVNASSGPERCKSPRGVGGRFVRVKPSGETHQHVGSYLPRSLAPETVGI